MLLRLTLGTILLAAASGLGAFGRDALPAAAAPPCGTAGVLTGSSTAGTCTYSYTGAADVFQVPVNITSVSVVVTGGKGAPGATGSGNVGGAAGFGSVVTGDFAVANGFNVQVQVGQNASGSIQGNNPYQLGGGSGGTPGGATGGGGGGGGAHSAVRYPGNPNPRVVAGGGGGGGGGGAGPANVGGDAGNGASAGQAGTGNPGSGGGGGSSTAGGAGGAFSCGGSAPSPGTTDAGGLGGGGGNFGGAGGGGGGGGGYFGGGGGSADACNPVGGGGGGGGSNLVPAGGTVTVDSTGVPQIVITFPGKNITSASLTMSATPVALNGSAHGIASISGATGSAGGTFAYSVYTDIICATLYASHQPANSPVTVTNALVPNSSDVSFETPGTYYWRGLYSGDANNSGAQTACTQFVVNKSATSVSLTLLPSATIAPGSAAHASSTITGATANAGGQLFYAIYTDNTCSTWDNDHQPANSPVTVTNGVAPNSDAVTFASLGTFYWWVFYGGDDFNSSASSVCTPLNVKNAPTVSITLVPVSPVTVGALVHGTAALSGATANAGGSATYTVYTENTCTTQYASHQPAGNPFAVTNAVVTQSSNVTFDQAGTFYWQVSYSGDGDNSPASSTCSSGLLLVKALPSVSLAPSPVSPVTVGTLVRGTATLSNATATAGGTATYAVYTENTCTTQYAGHQPVGNPFTVTNGTVTQSSNVTFDQVGTFYWQVVYSGDTNNNGATSICASGTLTVNKASPTIGVALVPSASVAVNTAVRETATLTGATATAGGTVTYSVYTNNICTLPYASHQPTGNPVAVTNGIVGNSGNVTFDQAGTFYWQAAYTGDTNNNGVTSTCASGALTVNKASPTIGVALVPSASVAVNTAVRETATLTGATPTAGGTVTYSVYTNNICTTLYAGHQPTGNPVAVNNGIVGNSGNVTFDQPGTFYWQAAYTGDANNNGVTSTCASGTLTVTGLPILPTTIGIFRSASWYLNNQLDGSGPEFSFGYGAATDIPVAGDWDCSGSVTPGVFRNGAFYLSNAKNGTGPHNSFFFGGAGDVPIVGDWNGDGCDSVGVFRGGWFFMTNAVTGSPAVNYSFFFGAPGDIPVTGDWDGNGSDGVGIFRGGNFYLTNAITGSPAPNYSFAFGIGSDVPVTGDWDANGATSVGIFRNGSWYLTNAVTGSPAVNYSFAFGATGDKPLTGAWGSSAASAVPLSANNSAVQTCTATFSCVRGSNDWTGPVNGTQATPQGAWTGPVAPPPPGWTGIGQPPLSGWTGMDTPAGATPTPVATSPTTKATPTPVAPSPTPTPTTKPISTATPLTTNATPTPVAPSPTPTPATKPISSVTPPATQPR